MIYMVVVIAAGLLIDSRRFLLLLPALPVVWLALAWRMKRSALGTEAGATILVSILSFVTVNIVSAPAEFERFRFGSGPFAELRLFSSPKTDAIIEVPNRTYPEVISPTIVEGFGSRMDRWMLSRYWKPDDAEYRLLSTKLESAT